MTGEKFERLVGIMERLRGPDGCPWDKAQDLRSLQPMLIEEVYEVVEAVDAGNHAGLAEELGDLLLHVVFHAQLGRESGWFGIDQVLDGIAEKLIRRHPHVFAGAAAADPEAVLDNWEKLKQEEKAAKSAPGAAAPASLLDGIPSRLPALQEAHKISARVARVGFDWPAIDGVFQKLHEEVGELRDAIRGQHEAGGHTRVEDEIGDLLFVAVNLARFLHVDSELALKRANRKFRTRFQYLERELERAGKTPSEATSEEMESMWQKAKRQGR